MYVLYSFRPKKLNPSYETGYAIVQYIARICFFFFGRKVYLGGAKYNRPNNLALIRHA